MVSEKALEIARDMHCRYCGVEGYKCSRDVEVDAEFIDSLVKALEELATAAEHRDNTEGDPCRLIECKARLEQAAKNARQVLTTL